MTFILEQCEYIIHFENVNVKKKYKKLLCSDGISTVNYGLIIIFQETEKLMYFKYSLLIGPSTHCVINAQLVKLKLSF